MRGAWVNVVTFGAAGAEISASDANLCAEGGRKTTRLFKDPLARVFGFVPWERTRKTEE